MAAQLHTRSRKPKRPLESGAPIPAMAHWLNILGADHFSSESRVLPMRASASEIPTTRHHCSAWSYNGQIDGLRDQLLRAVLWQMSGTPSQSSDKVKGYPY